MWVDTKALSVSDNYGERDGVVRGRMVALYLSCISTKSSSIDGLIEREGSGSFVKGRGASGKG